MSSLPVRMTVEWTVRPEQFRPSRRHCTRHDGHPRRARMHQCSLATELDQKVTLHFAEAWDSEESLKRHVRSDRFVTLAGLMESATEAPRVEFALPTRPRPRLRRRGQATSPGLTGTWRWACAAQGREAGVGSHHTRPRPLVWRSSDQSSFRKENGHVTQLAEGRRTRHRCVRALGLALAVLLVAGSDLRAQGAPKQPPPEPKPWMEIYGFAMLDIGENFTRINRTGTTRCG